MPHSPHPPQSPNRPWGDVATLLFFPYVIVMFLIIDWIRPSDGQLWLLIMGALISFFAVSFVASRSPKDKMPVFPASARRLPVWLVRTVIVGGCLAIGGLALALSFWTAGGLQVAGSPWRFSIGDANLGVVVFGIIFGPPLLIGQLLLIGMLMSRRWPLQRAAPGSIALPVLIAIAIVMYAFASATPSSLFRKHLGVPVPETADNLVVTDGSNSWNGGPIHFDLDLPHRDAERLRTDVQSYYGGYNVTAIEVTPADDPAKPTHVRITVTLDDF